MIRSVLVFLMLPLILGGKTYEISDVIISEIDIWGLPILKERKSGNKIDGNPLKNLYRLYASPNLQSQKKQIFERNDQEGLINLCALWAYVVPGEERSQWRNEIIENVFGIKLENVKSGDELINSKVFSENTTLDSRLCLFLELLLTNKIGVSPPPIVGNTDVLGFEVKRGQALRFHAIAKISGDAELIKSSEVVLSCLWGIYVLEIFSEGNRTSSHVNLISLALSKEFGVELEADYKESVEKISERLGRNNPGVRLASALLKKESHEQEYETEIICLSEELFPPAYPFMEAIARKKGGHEEAAYFRYLANRSPWNLNELIERCTVKGIITQILMPNTERFFDSLIQAKRYDEAYNYGIYVLALLNQSAFASSVGKPLREKISRDLIHIDREPSFKDVLDAGKRIRNEGYVNRSFETRYQKSLH